jgi:hypothetical protein
MRPVEVSARSIVGKAQVARRQSSPATGKRSARVTGQPGCVFVKEGLRRSLSRHCVPVLQRTIPGAGYAFYKAWRNLSVRCDATATKPWGGTVLPPDGRPRAQVEERVGRTTLRSSSAMSSGRLFLDRVARQHCPSPLHRHAQANTSFSAHPHQGDISTLREWVTFLFCVDKSARQS